MRRAVVLGPRKTHQDGHMAVAGAVPQGIPYPREYLYVP
jgi:hypothetical protein